MEGWSGETPSRQHSAIDRFPAVQTIVTTLHICPATLIRVRQGTEKKDRYARLTPYLPRVLRHYWQAYRPDTILFPGAYPNTPYDLATPGQLLKKVCRIETAVGAIPSQPSSYCPWP